MLYRAGCYRVLASLILAILMGSVHVAQASRIILKIRAGNSKSNSVEKVTIKANLPERVGTNDIISLGGLELGYDIKTDTYYVFKEIELQPRATVTYNVELKDLWAIPDEELALLESKARDLAALLADKAESEEASSLQKELSSALLRIREEQERSSIRPGVAVSQHITSYESNMLALERVKEGIGSLENLVLGSGQDPGELIGIVKDVPEPVRDLDLPQDQYRTVNFRIKVTNPSERESRKISMVRELPSEITLDDVIDAGGLELKSDPKTMVTYVCTNDLEIAAGETVSFTVKILDKWNINGPRVVRLREMGSNILSRLSATAPVESIAAAVSSIDSELAGIGVEPVPKTLDADYVAFFRDQSERVDLLEAKLNRISAALRPINKNQKLGFNAKPPSSKTTWMIIYIILGFLLFMSVLFFFRWWGGSSASDDGPDASGGDNASGS